MRPMLSTSTGTDRVGCHRLPGCLAASALLISYTGGVSRPASAISLSSANIASGLPSKSSLPPLMTSARAAHSAQANIVGDHEDGRAVSLAQPRHQSHQLLGALMILTDRRFV